MINHSLKNKKLIICYESREKFKESIKKEVDKNTAESWSKFLIDHKSIESIKNFLVRKGLDTEVLELDNIERFKKIIDAKGSIDLLLWNISDGCDIYKGSYVPSFAKLLNIKFFGSETYAQYIAQDKFKFVSICEHLDISVPKSILYLYRQNNYLPQKPTDIFSKQQFLFIKPNIFDNNIGILENAKTNINNLNNNVEELSNKIESDVLVQEYIDGFDLRVCFIGDKVDINKIGVLKIEKYNIETNGSIDFINESEANKIDFKVTKYTNSAICNNIVADVIKLINSLHLKDYFAFDVRVSKDETKYYFIELNTAPFIINRTMDAYAQLFYDKTISKVFYDTIVNSF